MGKLRATAIALGAPGLFLIAFLDGSFLSLPEVADLLVVFMVTRHKSRMLLYVASATLGSLGGCLIMYFIGRKGGDAMVRKRFASGAVDKTLKAFQRYGIMAVLIPAILPPPAPFKIFVLLAGVAGIEVWRFTVAVLVGRGFRYLVLGVLAYEYGDRAMTYMSEHGVAVSLTAVGVVGAGFAAYLVWTKARAAKSR